MRPLELELQYFGPYQHEIIDFTQFQDQSLFLVAGNTGAGKTTIFDAMCYALFGQTTNDRDRSATALRSDFAPSNQETVVKFTFFHQNATYQITRKPKQTLIGRRGKAVTHNQAVELLYPLEQDTPHALTKVKDVDMLVTNLLNLTRDQFKQIVLLPQGKFRQFLDADSNTKEDLLRELFKTTNYDQWAQALKDTLRQQKKDLATQATKLQSLKEMVTTVDAQQATADWLVAVKEQAQQLDQGLIVLQAEESRQQAQIKQLTARLHSEQQLQANLSALVELQIAAQALAKCQGEIESYRQQLATLEWFQKHQTTFQRWQDGEQRCTSLLAQRRDLSTRLKGEQAAAQTASSRLGELTSQQSKINNMQVAVLTLREQLPLFAERDRLQTEVDSLHAQVRGDQQTLAALQSTLTTDKKQLASINQHLKKHVDLPAKQLALVKEQGDLDQLKQVGQQLQEELAKLAEAQAKQTSIKQKLSTQQVVTDKADKHLATLNDCYARQQIALLARKLKDGSPCPVCGATSHPHPARLSVEETAITEEQLQAAEKTTQQQKARLTQLKEQLRQNSVHLQELREQTVKYQGQVCAGLGTSSLPDNWQAQINYRNGKLITREQELTSQQQQVKNWQQEKDQLEQIIAEQTDKVNEATANLQGVQQELVRLETILQEKEGALPAEFASQEAAKKELGARESEIEKFKQALQELQSQAQQAKQQVVVTTSSLQQTRTELTSQQASQKQLHTKLTQLLENGQPDKSWEFWQESVERLPQLPKLRQEISAYETQVHDNQRQQAGLKRLIDGQSAPDLAATQKQLSTAQQAAREKQQAIGQTATKKKQLQTTIDKVEKIVQTTGKIDQKINELQTLTDVVTGNTENHLSLERYVLQAYFQDVLVAANLQLSRLTNGRYQFELAAESKGASAKWTGLEVNVYDDNAGKTRSARTLSGGESFMAALALALALCQIIQEQSGGITIDALFIDEGFGSLDQEALADALRALQELEGHRMIGIISHVTELAEQIPDQLHVKALNGRSMVSYQHEL